jgi:hypothetical protein
MKLILLRLYDSSFWFIINFYSNVVNSREKEIEFRMIKIMKK